MLIGLNEGCTIVFFFFPLSHLYYNCQSWAVKIQSFLKALNLWDVIESDTNPTPLLQNPTLAQIKKHEEEMARNL